MRFSNFSHIFFGERVEVVFLAALIAATMATFGNHIGVIVDVCSEKEMIRSHARRVIAFMEYLKSFRDWPVVEFPRESVRCDAPRYLAAAGRNGKVAVSVSAISLEGSDPFPTTIFAFSDVLPKSLFDWLPLFWNRSIASLSAVFSGGMIRGYKLSLAR